MNKREQKLLIFAKFGEVETKEVPALLSVSYKAGAKYLRELVDAGFLKKKCKGVYEITQAGIDYVQKIRPNCVIFLVGDTRG